MEIKYFGEIAEKTNKTNETISIEKQSLFELISFLENEYNILTKDIQIAVNHNLVSKDIDIYFNDKDEVAILSPFAGG
jgi:molybdopterin converting factor small subunit